MSNEKLASHSQIGAGRLLWRQDHRWLAVFGIPLALIGGVSMVAVWFLPGVDYRNAWPVILGGQFVPLGMVIMGLHLSLSVDEMEADQQTQVIVHRRGMRPFQRVTRFDFDTVCAVVVEDVVGSLGNSGQYALAIEGAGIFHRFWISRDLGAIETEACQWAEFLNVDVQRRQH
jgi:hypothetical protein